jgi:hypothetical protein
MGVSTPSRGAAGRLLPISMTFPAGGLMLRLITLASFRAQPSSQGEKSICRKSRARRPTWLRQRSAWSLDTLARLMSERAVHRKSCRRHWAQAGAERASRNCIEPARYSARSPAKPTTAAGFHHDRLRHDPLMKIAVTRCPETGEPLASQPTIARLENAAPLCAAMVDSSARR